ncbi:hypothetical protein L5515_009233 [Caenorhabditis briggsae]|uniref:Uncharacterized protein n=1 Tax=Caenorhabditis briggsae TaxID=6238 RepID=A0AAE9F3J5_CAEBR|nr:hypothetical protein L5515_009233 [Caenorhabditis briggsae]
MAQTLSEYHATNYSRCVLDYHFLATWQEEAKLEVLKLDPCPTSEYFFADVLLITSDATTIHFFTWVLIPLLLFHSLSHVLFHATCTVYYIFIAPSKSTSAHTRQIQRQFFIGLIFQTGIPVVLLVAPISYSIMAFLLDNLDQEWMNLAVIISGLHGLGESLVVILVHSSYRNAVWRMIPKAEVLKNYGVPPTSFPRIVIVPYEPDGSLRVKNWIVLAYSVSLICFHYSVILYCGLKNAFEYEGSVGKVFDSSKKPPAANVQSIGCSKSRTHYFLGYTSGACIAESTYSAKFWNEDQLANWMVIPSSGPVSSVG